MLASSRGSGLSGLGLFQGPNHPGPCKGVQEAGDESEGTLFKRKHKENLRVPSSQLPRSGIMVGPTDRKDK